MDVLEHIENDNAALEKISSLLFANGHALFAIPSNPREWRWDDDYYGHCKRYAAEEIKKKLIDVGLEPIVFWDFTYPVFWVLRRIYTRLKPFSKNIKDDKYVRTAASSSINAWDIPFLSNFLSRNLFFWDIVYKIQFTYFRNKVRKGYEMIVLARKVI